MAIESSTQVVDLQRAGDCLSQLCASQGEFERFFSEVFEQLDMLSSQLLRRHQLWQTQCSETEAEYRRKSEQVARQQAEAAAQHEQLDQRQKQLQEQLDSATASAAAADDDRLHQALEQIEHQRAQFVGVMQETQKRSSELAEATAELVQTRQQLQNLLASADAIGPAGALEVVQQQLGQMQRERISLEQERAALEAELEAVRNRAAELTETLAQQKREVNQERAQWTDELKRLRRLMESLSAQQMAPLSGGDIAAPETAEVRPSANAPAAEADPVINSVMAQFDLLQKDLARRRKQHAATGG